MKYVLTFFKKHRFITLHIIILATAFFSFRYFIERALTPVVGMGWAFLIDQTIPLIVASVVTFLFLRKKISLKTIQARLKKHQRLLILIFAIAFVTHLGILYYFFWSDEVIFMLEPITQNSEFYFHQIGTASMRGYFLASYVFLYLVFGVHAWVYPLFSLFYFATSVLLVYWFIYLLTNKKLISTVASLFFATTPLFLDMFTWHSTAHAPILILGLVSFTSLLYYKKSGRFIYYLLSIMFFFVAIKMGFIRSAGFVFIPLLLLLSPLYNHTRQKLLYTVLYALPYIAIALYFVLFEFLYYELENSGKILMQTGNFGQTLGYLLGYRAVDSSLFLPKLSYFTAQLFIPSGLAAEVFPSIHPFFPKVSIAIALGQLSLFALLASFFVALKYKERREGWLIIFGVLFILINMLHSVIGYQAPSYFSPSNPEFAQKVDSRFAFEHAGYGPGSRYLFISSMGVSLLFALFVAWLARKRKIFSAIAVIFCIGVIASNAYFTIRAQVKNFKAMTQYKSLVQNIFKVVPRDGKPKLLFSANPEKNGLDSKFRHWTWLYGFYKTDELVYSTDPQEVKELIKDKQYMRENLYAFYNNPQTLAFTDISEETRNYFFPNSPDNHAHALLEFQSQKVKSTEIALEGSRTILVERAIIESSEVNKQIIVPQVLKFKIKIQRIKNPSFPLSDTLFINKGKDKKYPYSFPLKLWEWLVLPPQITNNPGDIKQENVSTSIEKQSQVLNILKERENLRAGTKINEFAADAVMEKGANTTPSTLIDGFYTTYPNPRKGEGYFVSNTSPVVLILSFPYVTGIKRIMLNTPDNYSSFFSSQNVVVFSSSDGRSFQKIATTENKVPDVWSPNRGKRYRIDLPKTVDARALGIEISSTKAIALDEIVIDGEDSLAFSPQDIYETARSTYRYVESKAIFEQLSQIRMYDRLSLLWSCANDSDWEQQQKRVEYSAWLDPQKNKEGVIDGIWNLATINIPPGASEVDDSVTINCYGSKLRKVFFVSPPYPVELEIVEAVIE